MDPVPPSTEGLELPTGPSDFAGHVLNSLADGIVVTDEGGFILYTNAAQDAMFGYERGELEGKHVSVLNMYPPEENARRVNEATQHLKDRGVWQRLCCSLRKDQSTFYTWVRIRAAEYNGRPCWIATQQSIADRRPLEEQFETLADSIANLAWMAHSDGYIFWYNRRWYEYTGTTPDEMEGWGWQSVHSPEELPRVNEAWRQSLKTGQPFEMVFPLRGADGSFRPFLTRAVPMFDSSGYVDRWFGTCTDISAQVEAEAALRAIENRLLQVVEASGKLLQSLSVSQVLSDTVEIAPRLVASDAVAIWRADEDSLWSIAASVGLSEEYVVASRRISGPMLAEGMIAISDVMSSPGTEVRRQLYEREGIRAMLGVPLRIRGGLNATMMFYFGSVQDFTDGEREVARALGNVAASALTSAEMYERQAEIRRVAEAGERRAGFLARAGAMLISSLNPETTLSELVSLAVPDVADYVWIELRDPAGRPAVVAARHRREAPERSLADAVLAGAPLPAEWAAGQSAEASIRIAGRVAGRVVFGVDSPGRLLEADERLAAEIGLRISTALENSRLHLEVREAEERARLAIEAAEMGTWDLDLVTRRPTLSARCKAFFGLAPDAEPTQELFASLVHPDDQALVSGLVARSADPSGEGSAHVEFRAMLPDGSVRWLLSVGRVLFEGEGPERRAVRMIGIMRDITGQRLAEQERQALLAGEQEARSSAELLNRVGPILLSELDRDRLVQKLVDICTRLIGAQNGALVHDFTSPSPVRIDDCTLDPKHQADSPFPGDLTRSLLAVPVQAPSGESFGTLVFGHAQAARFGPSQEQLAAGIAAQAAVALDNVRLFEEAIHVQDALAKANLSLRAANTDLEQFAFAAAHDLREPLRMVTTYTQLLERRLGDQLAEEYRRLMMRIVEGSGRMADLLQDLLSYTNTATHTEPAGRVDLNAVVDSVLQNLSAPIADSRAVVHVDTLPTIRGLAGHMVLVFQNLIGNAIKYRRAGVAPVVSISAKPQDGEWLFRVEDNGIGIDPRYQAQIFGVFKRLHGRDIPGTGIGLAICQRAVERAGGRIWVESTPGRGSTFLFTVPTGPAENSNDLADVES